MTLLGAYRPATKPIWNVDLTSYDSINRAGGILTGAPKVDSNGLHLDGATQYLTCAPVMLSSFSVKTLEIEFTPESDWNDGVGHMLFQLQPYPGGGAYYSIYKSAAGVLQLYIVDNYYYASSTGLAANWKTGQRNSLVAVLQSGAISAYLNGALLTTSASAFTRTGNEKWYAVTGAQYGGGQYCDMTFHRVNVYDTYWTPDEASRSYRHDLWNYREKASLWLDMKDATENTEKDGGEKLTDGNMEAAGTAAWTPYLGSSTLTKDTTNPHSGTQCLRITNGVVLENGARQSTALVPGGLFRWRGWARGNGTAYPRVSTGTVVWSGTTSTDWQYFDIPRVAGSASAILFSEGGGIGDWCEFDDCSVVPTGQLLDDGACEMEGVGEWTTSNATLTKVDGALNIAYLSTAAPYCYQSVLTSGRVYRVTGEARGDGTVIPSFASGSEHWRGTSSTEWQKFDATFTSTSTWARYYLLGSSGYVEFRNLDVRPVYRTTTDKSRHGRLVTLGDGYTAAGMPAFENPGYSYNGSSSHLRVHTGDLLASPQISFVIGFSPDFLTSEAVTRYLVHSTNAKIKVLKYSVGGSYALSIDMGGSSIHNIPPSLYAHLWKINGMNTITAVCESGNSDIYFNDTLVRGADTSVYTPTADDIVYIGTSNIISAAFIGGIQHFSMYDFKLSPIQVRELTADLLGGNHA